jgi:hypothetical protein
MQYLPQITQLVLAAIIPFVAVYFTHKFTMRREQRQRLCDILTDVMIEVARFRSFWVREHRHRHTLLASSKRSDRLYGEALELLEESSSKLESQAVAIGFLFKDNSHLLIDSISFLRSEQTWDRMNGPVRTIGDSRQISLHERMRESDEWFDKINKPIKKVEMHVEELWKQIR